MNVLAAQCPTCIFRPGNPMFLEEGALARMVAACRRHDVHIPCHERMTQPETEPEAGPDGLVPINMDDPVCRGFYDAYPGVGQVLRISARLGMLKEVP